MGVEQKPGPVRIHVVANTLSEDPNLRVEETFRLVRMPVATSTLRRGDKPGTWFTGPNPQS